MLKVNICVFSQTCRFGPAFWVCSLDVCENSFLLPLGTHTGSWLWSWGVSGREYGVLGLPVGLLQDPQLRHPQCLVDGRDGVQDAVIRIHILLICSFLNPGCYSPTCSLTGCCVLKTVLWMRQERDGHYWQCLIQLGKLGAHSHIWLSLAGEIIPEKGSLGLDWTASGEG